MLPLLFGQRSLEGVTPPEGMPSGPFEGAESPSVTTVPSATSQEQPVKGDPTETSQGVEVPLVPWMGKKCCTHPSLWWLQGSPFAHQKSLEQTYLLVADHHQPTNIVPLEPISPTWKLEVAHQWVLTPGFLEVTACLKGQLPREVLETPPVPLPMGMMTTPGVMTMSASCVI